ncbi:MAG: hypothetical protein QOI51_1360 [Nocardioidaceae bacterium]|nr:hypothetical protein [Nocardioidaceae bacterium]
MSVTLLGPQRRPTVDQVVRAVDPDVPLATVTAGWQEREPDDAELDALLGGRSINLGLYARLLDIQERDRELAIAELDHRTLLDELRQLHLVQLESALGALHALAQRSGERPQAIEDSLADAEAVVRLIDERHIERVHAANEDFAHTYSLEERPAVVEHRGDVLGILEQAGGLVIAGGHVGVLLRALHFFRVAALVPPMVIAWSAGAMALTEKVVLFHDRTPQGPTPAEIFDRGMGVIRGVVVLPDARRRLIVDDPIRMSALARRFAPAECVILDPGVRLDLPPAGGLPPGARVIDPEGRIVALEAA